MSKRFDGFYHDHELPLQKGQVVTIKKGTVVKTSLKGSKPAGKTYKIKIDHILPGMNRPDPNFNVADYPTKSPSVRWGGRDGWNEVDINDIPEAVEALPNLAEIEHRLGEKAEKWAGRCYEIACAIVEAGLVKGTAVYGHFVGEIDPKAYFGDRAGMPFVQHGWVLLEDGRVFDPTRFAFDGKEPYIHVGPMTEEYDEGGNQWREAARTPPPEYDPDERQIEFSMKVLPSPAWTHVEKILDIQYFGRREQNPGTLSIGQVFWLANAPFEILKPHAETIYKAIETVGEAAFIPMDNRKRAEREAARVAEIRASGKIVNFRKGLL